jgi:hypothetical protein
MKKLILSTFMLLALSLSSFANTGVSEIGKELSKKEKPSKNLSTNKEEEESKLCRVTCCSTYSEGDMSYTTCVSAGWLLTSCDTAQDRCQEKLEDATTLGD